MKVDTKLDPDRTEADVKSDIVYVGELKEIVTQFYWTLFHAKVGARFHAFIEWCGVMSKHLDIMKELLVRGGDPLHGNIHTGTPVDLEQHHWDYLNEKIECIFGGQVKVVPTSQWDADQDELKRFRRKERFDTAGLHDEVEEFPAEVGD